MSKSPRAIRSRRSAIMALAVAGTGVASMAAGRRDAGAAAGDPVLAGRINDAGGDQTWLRSSSTKATLKLANSGQGGRALEADAGSGIAASLYSRNLGLSVISQANGIFIHADHGQAIEAHSDN